MKRSVAVVTILFASAVLAFAQNNNTSSGRTRTVEPRPAATPKSVAKSPNPEASPSPQTAKRSATTAAPSTAVLAAFDKIIDGIRRSNVDLYTSGYWNSPALVLFNYNGTVTKGWEQLKKNRESSFPQS